MKSQNLWTSWQVFKVGLTAKQFESIRRNLIAIEKIIFKMGK